MSGSISLGDLPSWILVVLIGIGLSWANSNAILTQFAGLGKILVYAGLALGAFHILNDVLNKI